MDSQTRSQMWKHWEKSGKSDFLKFMKSTVKSQNADLFFKSENIISGITRAIYELVWQCLLGRLKKEAVLNALSEISHYHWDIPTIILDVINIVDAETSIVGTDGYQDERAIFCEITKDIDSFMSEKLLKERLEIDTLQDSGTVKPKVFYTKFIKIKTKLYYKQRRFNLFREESEGYAKLITELNQEFDEKTFGSSNAMDMIKSLIGCFNLDPNRVLDIILESFETKPENHTFFIPLLQSYMPSGSIICEVLGYKLRNFSNSVNSTPRSLFDITALLLKYLVIKLDDIYIWLSPTDAEITADWEKEMLEAKEYVRKLNIISTNKDKEPVEIEPEPTDKEDKYIKNQKFGLFESLLKVGNWKDAEKLINKLPEQCVVVHEPIAKALCELIHRSINSIYSKKCSELFAPVQSVSKKEKSLLDIYFDFSMEAKTFNELSSYVFPMVNTLGPSLHYDPVLIYKLIRLTRTILSEMNVDHLNLPVANTDEEKMYYDVLNLIDSSILPALSYLDCNCCIAEEVWTVIKYFPYNLRYALYSKWKNESYLTQPELIIRQGNTKKNIKALMKRVSKENVKPVGRLIGKLSHCSPGFLFDYILLQIQIYDNLIGPVVDSLKYLTSLSYDVLGYCLIESLALADRDRFKDDGTSLSMWLQSLASFCGSIYKKYNIELSGLLQYVANQLKSQRSLDLLILKEVVQKMTGIEATEEMTNEQLNAMSGGELLRGEAGYFSQVRNTKKSSQRLKEALANNDLAVTLCLLMAQQKHCVIYRETARNHLKLVGKLYDQCQDTLVQFGTFLGSTYSVDEYVERLPSIIKMLQEYHIHSDVAFFLARPMFTHQINQKYDQLRKSDPNSKKLTTSQKMSKYLEATSAIMDPIVESVRPLHGPKVWEDISPQFLVTFWSLSMYDLQIPHDSYQKEITKIKQLSVQALDANFSKGKKEQERYIALMEKLQDEKRKQQEHVDKIHQRLAQEKDNWFLSRSAKAAKNETITQFLQLCLFPRCTFTALDAIYCAKFVHTIHTLKAANFSTLLCYDRIFCDITYSVTSCTENEATRYGRFLCAMLETVMKWHSDQNVFNKECASFPGFVTKFRVSNQFSEANDQVGYENYRHVCHKWHYKITKAIVVCLDSKDYMQIRNALIILMRILPHFPVLTKLSQIIERKVEKVREEEKNQRPDLFVLASSYIGQLKTRAANMIKESDFHQVSEKPQRDTIVVQDIKPVAPTSSLNGEIKLDKREKDKGDKKIIKNSINNDKDIKLINLTEILDKDIKKEVKDTKKEKEEKIKETKIKDDKDDDIRRKEKERRKEYRLNDSPIFVDAPHTNDYYFIDKEHDLRVEREREREKEKDRERERDRDLSSVSNSSNGSLQRRSQEHQDFEKETKRRKVESQAGSSSNTSSLKKIQQQQQLQQQPQHHQNDPEIYEIKKERSSKTKDRKEKSMDDEKELLRKERKLGRKRERLEENSSNEHKRRRGTEANPNGADDESSRGDKYHSREKSPHGSREAKDRSSHDKFEREKSYTLTKSTRSRVAY
ncbi:THO complex subunit 2 [Condylostylus longicornis]|uniref:THO complex subunit 2 n=1 Tax=Condylostylus longicornis TaxID=2530218 RepID=UPI00244E4FED|nr:THO complex subunit 2 [Condylostylus longicornis]